jgi:acetylornithine deacetylase
VTPTGGEVRELRMGNGHHSMSLRGLASIARGAGPGYAGRSIDVWRDFMSGNRTAALEDPMQAAEPSVKDILAKLVSFDTTSHKTNLPCAEWIRDYLGGFGVEARLLPAGDGIHANLMATIGPGDGGIALSGHMDVVPVTGQPWSTDPFNMIEKDGRLYGRGTTDMKGYLACMLAMVPEFVAAPLKQPVHLLFSYDEEVGCTGVTDMIDRFGRDLPKPDIVFVGEPSRMSVVDAHKGGYRFVTTVTGKDAHSSKPQLGVGAIFIAAELIAELKRIEARVRERTHNPRFDPPHLTISVSAIDGGIAHNIIPPKCSFTWGTRAMPGHDSLEIKAALDTYAATLLPAMRAVHPACTIVTETMGGLPPFWSGDNSPATSLALKIAGQNQTFAVPYGTEASHFQAAGCSSVICGPGDISQAHQPDEYIDVAELDRCMAFLRRLRVQISA